MQALVFLEVLLQAALQVLKPQPATGFQMGHGLPAAGFNILPHSVEQDQQLALN